MAQRQCRLQKGLMLMNQGWANTIKTYRTLIEAEIERLIATLDALDGDADFEPSLAAPKSPSDWRSTQVRWAIGGSDDRENDGDDLERDDRDLEMI